MAFSKFEPDRPEERTRWSDTPEGRRAWLLKVGWVITMVYTAIGFAFVGIFLIWGNPF